jgi:hypothetical protein
MIKFFRKIRRKLLKDGRFGRYMIYAIGEIALVVIGILIALWINNVNEGVQESRIEMALLENFENDLSADVATLREIMGHNEERTTNTDSIISLLAQKQSLTRPDLIKFYHWNSSLAFESYFIPERSTINQLGANENGRIISSEVLRDKLFRYYSTTERIEANVEMSIQLYQHNYLTKGILQNILSGEITEILIGNDLGRPAFDLEDLKQNSEYIFALSTKKIATSNQNEVYQRILESAEELIVLIGEEIK